MTRRSHIVVLWITLCLIAHGLCRAEERHWSLAPLTQPAVPAGNRINSCPNPIDAFVLAKLDAMHLAPSPPADRRTLLRRLCFDLTGLPPTPEQMSAFLSDRAADAYEKQVDRLLVSPRYGERWARHWMDVVHYAESHGHDEDRERPNAWPYRDYLIRSFNYDKPYGRFVEEQVAGDVLYPDDPQGVVATGFIAAGPWDESSQMAIQDDTADKRIARNLDRDDMVTVTMNTFASMTVQCARCHNHKFDPITQKEYYGLQAVFAGVDRADRPYDPDPKVFAERSNLLREKAGLESGRYVDGATPDDPAVMASVAAWEKSIRSAEASWTVLDATSFTSAAGATLTKQPDRSILSSGARPDKDTYTITASTTLPRVGAIRLELLTDDTLPHRGPGRQDNGNLHVNEFYLKATPNDSTDAAEINVEFSGAKADFDQNGWTAAMAIDRKPDTAWGIYPQIGKPHVAIFTLRKPLDFPNGSRLTFVIEQTHGQGHLIGRLRLAVAAETPPVEELLLPPNIGQILDTRESHRSQAQRLALATFWLRREIDRKLSALPPPHWVYAASHYFKPAGNFKPAMTPRPVFVLKRGDINQPAEPAEPGALSCVAGLDSTFNLPDPQDEGGRRGALARWLSSPRNMLTWRSIANRVWHYHFGRGIATTPSDFGRMGAPPTHPELLDFLACYLLEHGQSLKALHRLIVTSATYRQSSRTNPQFAKSDGTNQFLWRMNASRLDAESIHDAILQVSGMLDTAMGGPSAKQFVESPGIHVTPVVDYAKFDVDGPGSRRRSVYRFVFRTLPDPFMDAMDCPDASQLTPVRNTSVTALQALAMWNDKFVLRYSRRLAERIERERPDLPGQIDRLYELCLNRAPTREEREAVSSYASRNGLANACRVVLNSNEFVFVE